METHFPFSGDDNVTSGHDQLLADTRIVVRDIEELLNSAAGQLSEKAAAELKAVLARAKELRARLETRASAGLRQADQVIRKHPYPSLGAAFALGTLIGVLINRR